MRRTYIMRLWRNAKKSILNGVATEMPDDMIDDLKSAKCGKIRIKKVSDNIGYLSANESISGHTFFFGTGISLYIDCPQTEHEYYYTSVIKKIDWDNNKFYTLNSVYEFEFEEMSFEDVESIMGFNQND